MNDTTATQTVLFPDLVAKPLVATFDQAHASSDGGAILLRAAVQRLQLTTRLSRCLTDARDPDRVTHALSDFVAQRVFGIACGYPDANEATASPTIRSRSCCSIGIRCTASRWRRNRRCRALRMARAPGRLASRRETEVLRPGDRASER